MRTHAAPVPHAHAPPRPSFPPGAPSPARFCRCQRRPRGIQRSLRGVRACAPAPTQTLPVRPRVCAGAQVPRARRPNEWTRRGPHPSGQGPPRAADSPGGSSRWVRGDARTSHQRARKRGRRGQGAHTSTAAAAVDHTPLVAARTHQLPARRRGQKRTAGSGRRRNRGGATSGAAGALRSHASSRIVRAHTASASAVAKRTLCSHTCCIMRRRPDNEKEDRPLPPGGCFPSTQRRLPAARELLRPALAARHRPRATLGIHTRHTLRLTRARASAMRAGYVRTPVRVDAFDGRLDRKS